MCTKNSFRFHDPGLRTPDHSIVDHVWGINTTTTRTVQTATEQGQRDWRFEGSRCQGHTKWVMQWCMSGVIDFHQIVIIIIFQWMLSCEISQGIILINLATRKSQHYIYIYIYIYILVYIYIYIYTHTYKLFLESLESIMTVLTYKWLYLYYFLGYQ